MKKVTLQDVADALNVSRISVWKVFSGRSGVSKELRDKIISKAIELNYNFPQNFILPDDLKKTERQYNISVTVSQPETSSFWMTVVHDIAKEFAKYNVNFFYTYLPSQFDSNYELPAQLSNGSIDGMLIINVYDKKLIHMLSDLKLPKVFIDSSSEIDFNDLNGDLMLTFGRSYIAKITQHIIAQGKTKIGYIGDIMYSRSNYERYQGYYDAMKANNLPINNDYCFTKCNENESYENALISFTKQLKNIPDAFICSNDHIASIVWNELQKRGYRIPSDILISGYNDLQESVATKELTTVQVFSKDLGMRLAHQILYKINNPTARNELVYISSQILFRNSTNAS